MYRMISLLTLAAALVATFGPALRADQNDSNQTKLHSAIKPTPRDAKWMPRHEKFVEIAKRGDIDLLFWVTASPTLGAVKAMARAVAQRFLTMNSSLKRPPTLALVATAPSMCCGGYKMGSLTASSPRP